jgi:glycine betaine/choline ABC-type transport system substrate-binding protein
MPVAAIAWTLVLGVLAAGCGGSGEETVGNRVADAVTLTIGTGDTSEETILGQIYAQALEGAGYEVRNVKLDVTDPEARPRALKAGRVSSYPDHLSSALATFAGRELEEVPADPGRAYREVQASFKKKGLTVFPPTPFSRDNAVGALKETADKWDLEKVSDLKGKSGELTIAGVTGCHGDIDCVGGLEQRYRLFFAGFVYDWPKETEPFRALETGFSDLAMLPTTDGRLAAKKGKFVTLEEDKGVFPAGNAIFVTTPRSVKEAGPKFEETIVAAQKGLTLSVMQKLDAKVVIKNRDPAAVAGEYLKEAGLGRQPKSG